MTYFKQFQNDIKSINKKWNSEDVYFSQYRDGYCASYKPRYPEGCTKDMTIQTLEGTGAYNRGRYILSIYKDGKYIAEYFNSIDELKSYFN